MPREYLSGSPISPASYGWLVFCAVFLFLGERSRTYRTLRKVALDEPSPTPQKEGAAADKADKRR